MSLAPSGGRQRMSSLTLDSLVGRTKAQMGRVGMGESGEENGLEAISHLHSQHLVGQSPWDSVYPCVFPRQLSNTGHVPGTALGAEKMQGTGQGIRGRQWTGGAGCNER